MSGWSGSSWYGTDSKVWAIVAASAAAATLAVSLIYTGSAKADQTGCTAAGMSSALGTVASGTGGWLSAHPAANDAITNAGPTGNEQAIRDYFIAHPAEWQELQGIANPLRSLRQGCSTQVGAGAVARLFDAMSG
jgi:hemophore-related protein